MQIVKLPVICQTNQRKAMQTGCSHVHRSSLFGFHGDGRMAGFPADINRHTVVQKQRRRHLQSVHILTQCRFIQYFVQKTQQYILTEISRQTAVHQIHLCILYKNVICPRIKWPKREIWNVFVILHVKMSCKHLKSHDSLHPSNTYWSQLVSHCLLLPLISWDNICSDQMAGTGCDL